MSASNSGGFEIGAATAGTTLSIQGRNLLNGASLAPNTLPSGAIARFVGTVTLTSFNLATVTVGPCAGFGTVSGGLLVGFDPSKTIFSAALLTSNPGVSQSCPYAVF